MYVLRALMWVPGCVFKSNRRGDGRIERSDAKCRWPHLMLYIKNQVGGVAHGVIGMVPSCVFRVVCWCSTGVCVRA